MKVEGSYAALMAYYFAPPDDEDILRHSLLNCQRFWKQERKGEKVRYRAQGCGRREVCPACGSYRQMVLAKEAVETILLVLEAVARAGVTPECHGLKLVKTIPKELSRRIDAKLQADVEGWGADINDLFEASREFNRRWYGPGVAGVSALHLTGESAPTEPHYHLTNYVLPVARDEDGRLIALEHWTPSDRLEAMKQSWASILNRRFGLSLKKADVQCGYLNSEGKLNHFIHYLYRHPLADLWDGWQGINGDGDLIYEYGKPRKQKLLSVNDMAEGAARLLALPTHFKRIRWFGPLSDGQRAKTMALLGLEAVPVDVEDDGTKAEGWERTGAEFRFVRYNREGVVLREMLPAKANAEPDDWDEDGWPVWRERLGPEFVVLDADADYRPSGVGIGKRKRWRVQEKVQEVSDA